MINPRTVISMVPMLIGISALAIMAIKNKLGIAPSVSGWFFCAWATCFPLFNDIAGEIASRKESELLRSMQGTFLLSCGSGLVQWGVLVVLAVIFLVLARRQRIAWRAW